MFSRRPPTVPTDQIVPVFFWDKNLHCIQPYWLAVFEEVLDAEKLVAALNELLTRDDWRKVGARLRKGRKGLEFHIPAEFTEQRPAFAYNHIVHEISISQHPTASQIPRASPSASQGPQVVKDADRFTELFQREKGPKCLQDYLYSDTPVLGVCITSFTDATLVSLNWSHAVFDAMGVKAILDAWSLTLQGRDSEVIPIQGLDADPMKSLGTNATTKYIYEKQMMGIGPTLKLGLRLAYNVVVSRPKQETRYICIPQSYLDAQRTQALANLKASSEGTGESVPFLSDGDLLCEWQFNAVINAIKPSRGRTLWFVNAFDLRRVLADELMDPGKAYLGNCLSQLPAPFTLKGAHDKPVGGVAAAIRTGIVRCGTREQVEARTALDRTSYERMGVGAVTGDSKMHVIANSNWAKARYFNVDFSAAVVAPGSQRPGKSAGRVGRPAQVLVVSIFPSLPFVSLATPWFVTGKDGDGNHWLQGAMSKKQWARFDKVHEAKAVEAAAGLKSASEQSLDDHIDTKVESALQ